MTKKERLEIAKKAATDSRFDFSIYTKEELKSLHRFLSRMTGKRFMTDTRLTKDLESQNYKDMRQSTYKLTTSEKHRLLAHLTKYMKRIQMVLLPQNKKRSTTPLISLRKKPVFNLPNQNIPIEINQLIPPLDKE